MSVVQTILTYVVFYAACILLLFRYSVSMREKLVREGQRERDAIRVVWKFRLGSILILAIITCIRVLMAIEWISQTAAFILVGGVGAVAAVMWIRFKTRLN